MSDDRLDLPFAVALDGAGKPIAVVIGVSRTVLDDCALAGTSKGFDLASAGVNLKVYLVFGEDFDEVRQCTTAFFSVPPEHQRNLPDEDFVIRDPSKLS